MRFLWEFSIQIQIKNSGIKGSRKLGSSQENDKFNSVHKFRDFPKRAGAKWEENNVVSHVNIVGHLVILYTSGVPKEESLHASRNVEHVTLQDGYKMEEESLIEATIEEHINTEEYITIKIISPTKRTSLEACDWETHIGSTLDGEHESRKE